jgi:hypothetical protein
LELEARETDRQTFLAAWRVAPLPRLTHPRQIKDNLILRREKVAVVAIEAFGPKMRTVLSVEESGVDPQAKSRLLDTRLDRVAHAQFVPDLREINGPSLKQEAVLRETTDTPGICDRSVVTVSTKASSSAPPRD